MNNLKKISFIFCCLALSGCATVVPQDTESVIAERVKERWGYLIKKEWNKVYQFETKGYRDSHTEDQFKTKFGSAVLWKNAQVVSVIIDKSRESAKVRIKMNFEANIPGFGGVQKTSTDLLEDWILYADQWWHYNTL